MRLLGSELTLHKLEVLHTVAQLESVSRAAERLGIAQPVVTAHIRSIEKKLGVKLTQRRGRNIAFTAEGMRVLVWVDEIVTRTRELQRELSIGYAGADGSAVICSSLSVGSYILPDMLVAFRQDHPLGEVAVDVLTPKGVTAAIRERRADFGITFLDPHHDLSGLRATEIGWDRLVLVRSAQSPIAADVGDAEIAAMPFISSARGSARREIEDAALLRFGIQRQNVVLELGHAEGIARATRSGAGISFVFVSSVARDLASGELELIRPERFYIDVKIFMLSMIDKTFSSFQEILYQFTISNFRRFCSNIR